MCFSVYHVIMCCVFGHMLVCACVVCMYISVYAQVVYVKFVCAYVYTSEKAMAPHSSTLAWKIPWTEEPGRLWSTGLLRVGHGWATSLSLFSFHATEKAMAPPLHYSCLENPRDGGAWWAAIYGVAQSRTPLKLLSSSSSNMYTHEHLMYDYATSMFIYTCAFLFMWVCRCVGICVWVFLCI